MEVLGLMVVASFHVAVEVQKVCYAHEGTLNKFLIDDKGMHLPHWPQRAEGCCSLCCSDLARRCYPHDTIP